MLDARELEEYIRRTQTAEDPINDVMMALVNEYIDNCQEALRIWNGLRGKAVNLTEGCERTVSILKKKKDIELIKKYGRWVLEENPQIGLTLFTTDTRTGEPPVDMNPGEVIDYLNGFDKQKEDQFPYLEFYYEYLINNTSAPDSYFTQLGTLYVERLFRLQPKQYQNPSNRPFFKTYR